MRNKVLELIYKRLEHPGKYPIFNTSRPFTLEWVGMSLKQSELMDFRLDFPDGLPYIKVKTYRTNTPWFLYRLGYGTKFYTIVECHPLTFQLTPLEQDSLEAAVRQHYQRHLQLKYDAEYVEMEEKVTSRLAKK